MHRTAPLLATLLVLGLMHSVGRTQANATKTLDESGTVKMVDSGRIQFDTAKFDSWWINFKDGTKLHVEGTAEPSYLRQGLNVRFSGEFDKKNVVQEDIKEIEIFTPAAKNGVGLFADASADKPVKSPAAGNNYDIRGKLTSVKDNEIAISCGTKKLTAKLSDDVAVRINVEDLKEVRAGDTVKVRAEYYDAQKATALQPGQALGDDVSITLQKPLAGLKKKAPAKATKTAKKKEKPAAEAGEESPLSVPDPFGDDNKGDDMKDDKPKGTKKKKPADDE